MSWVKRGVGMARKKVADLVKAFINEDGTVVEGRNFNEVTQALKQMWGEQCCSSKTEIGREIRKAIMKEMGLGTIVINQKRGRMIGIRTLLSHERAALAERVFRDRDKKRSGKVCRAQQYRRRRGGVRRLPLPEVAPATA